MIHIQRSTSDAKCFAGFHWNSQIHLDQHILKTQTSSRELSAQHFISWKLPKFWAWPILWQQLSCLQKHNIQPCINWLPEIYHWMAKCFFIYNGEHYSEYVFNKKKKTNTTPKNPIGILWVAGGLIKLHKKKTSHNMKEHEGIETLTFCQQKSFRKHELKDCGLKVTESSQGSSDLQIILLPLLKFSEYNYSKPECEK